MSTATKRDPKKWAAAKARARAKMGGKHSARAMQLAVKYYKDAGGSYSGPKKSNNKLRKWGRQKWQYAGKKVNLGIYLRKRLLRYRHPKGQRLIGRKKQTQEQESNLVNNQNQSQTKLGGTEYNAKIRRKKISLH